jgi:hypothetical protein
LVREHRKEKDAEEEEKKSSISLLRGVSIGSNTAAKELLIIKRLRKTEASWAVGEPQVESLDLEGEKKKTGRKGSKKCQPRDTLTASQVRSTKRANWLVMVRLNPNEHQIRP